MPTTQAPAPSDAQDENKIVRLHITPLRPELLKVYLAPSILPLAQNISYHTVETFPDKGFGYIELPEAEANKIKKKLNGTTLRGSKVKIEMAKSEKRKAREEADAAKDKEESDRPSKRVKKEKKKKNELGVLDGVELPDDRKVKRGWTEPTTTKSRKDKKERKDKKDKDKAREQKASKYTKEPEMLFKAKLTPVAATEVARKEKSKEKKKEKKDKNKSKSREVVVHEFEKNTKTPSFLKETKVAAVKKPAVDYVDGQGWVDEDGNVVEPETGKARQRRALELVDKPTDAQRAWIDGSSLPTPSSDTTSNKKKENKKAKQAPLPPSSPPESEDDDSSVVSSSSEDVSSESESESEAESSDAESAASARLNKSTQSPIPTSEAKEVHPLEALFKKTPKSDPAPTSAPSIKLTPINTSFSFFDNEEEPAEAEGDTTENMPTTPFTQRDLEWRGLRSAAPTPDTAAIGKRFSFDWRKSSQEADDDEDDEMIDEEAKQQLSQNTKANASAKHLPGVTEEDEEDADAGADQEQPESEFRRWFWENRGDLNRSWKKRRRDALKAKRHSENKKMTGGRRL